MTMPNSTAIDQTIELATKAARNPQPEIVAYLANAVEKKCIKEGKQEDMKNVIEGLNSLLAVATSQSDILHRADVWSGKHEDRVISIDTAFYREEVENKKGEISHLLSEPIMFVFDIGEDSKLLQGAMQDGAVLEGKKDELFHLLWASWLSEHGMMCDQEGFILNKETEQKVEPVSYRELINDDKEGLISYAQQVNPDSKVDVKDWAKETQAITESGGAGMHT